MFFNCCLYMQAVFVNVFLYLPLLLCHLYPKAIFVFVCYTYVVFVVVAHSHSWLAFWFYLISMLPRQIVRTSGVCLWPRTCWKRNLLRCYCCQCFCAICLISFVFPCIYYIQIYICTHLVWLLLLLRWHICAATDCEFLCNLHTWNWFKEWALSHTHTYKLMCLLMYLPIVCICAFQCLLRRKWIIKFCRIFNWKINIGSSSFWGPSERI